MKIGNILASKGMEVITIRPEQSLQAAIVLLAEHNIGSLVVVDASGQPIGIVSERDIVRKGDLSSDIFRQPVSRVMTTEVTTGSPHDDLMSVLHTMTEKRFRHVPIVDRGKLVGIVSIGDLVKAQLKEYQGEIDTLETQILEGK